MKRKVKVEWTDQHWCSNTIEVDVPNDIPADQVDAWITDHVSDLEIYDGFKTDDVETVKDSVEIEVIDG